MRADDLDPPEDTRRRVMVHILLTHHEGHQRARIARVVALVAGLERPLVRLREPPEPRRVQPLDGLRAEVERRRRRVDVGQELLGGRRGRGRHTRSVWERRGAWLGVGWSGVG